MAWQQTTADKFPEMLLDEPLHRVAQKRLCAFVQGETKLQEKFSGNYRTLSTIVFNEIKIKYKLFDKRFFLLRLD